MGIFTFKSQKINSVKIPLKNYLFKILVDFNKQTKSKRAQFIIENFDNEISKFIHVVPDEVIDKLEYPVTINHKIA